MVWMAVSAAATIMAGYHAGALAWPGDETTQQQQAAQFMAWLFPFNVVNLVISLHLFEQALVKRGEGE